MAEAKTRPTKASVPEFLKASATGERLADCKTLVKLMRAATGAKPVMWGPSIVGFGTSIVRYANGSEADWPIIAFSPRKGDISLYGVTGFPGAKELLAQLGKHKLGKSCLYVKRLADVDVDVLEQLITAAAAADEQGEC